MSTRTLWIAAAVALWAVPIGAAPAREEPRSEETRLIAVLNAQRARIAELQAQIRALSGAAASSASDTVLRSGLPADELRALRGEPDRIARNGAHVEIWSYGNTRVTLLGGRVASWQVGVPPPAISSAPAVRIPQSPICDADTPLPDHAAVRD